MTRLQALIVCAALLLAPSALAQEAGAGASPAFKAAQDGFEAAYLRAVRDIREGSPGERITRILEVAAPIAQRFYGRDWSVVRAETERRLALLESFDLGPYEDRRASFSWTNAESDRTGAEFAAALQDRPERLAVMRFYDPHAVGVSIDQMTLAAFLPADEFHNLTLATAFAPVRVYRARWRSHEALVARHGGWLVIIPYELSRHGLIGPDFPEVSVYPAS